MAKELERAGLNTVLITTIASLAARAGAARVLQGKAVPHPVGDPSVPHSQEVAFRRAMVRRALEAMQTPVTEPTLFSAPG